MPQRNTIAEIVIGRTFILFSFKTDVWKNMSLNGENCKVEAWRCNKQCHAYPSCKIAIETAKIPRSSTYVGSVRTQVIWSKDAVDIKACLMTNTCLHFPEDSKMASKEFRVVEIALNFQWNILGLQQNKQANKTWWIIFRILKLH